MVTAEEGYPRLLLGRIGVVFQDHNLFPHMTALRNIIEAPIHVKKVPKKEAVEKGRGILEKVGLADKLDVYPSRGASNSGWPSLGSWRWSPS